jgi:predicted ribosomally synthesized peptide with nif11-like leader
MVNDSVRRFMKEATSNEKLRQQLKIILEYDSASFLERAVRIGLQHGFKFSKEDMYTVIREFTAPASSDELNDAQLQTVVGGAESEWMTVCRNYFNNILNL